MLINNFEYMNKFIFM